MYSILSAGLILDNAEATATATGSTGWETILRGKPAMIFGAVWYENCSGILRIGNLEDARRAVQKIQDGYKPNHEDVVKYVEYFNEVGAEIQWRRTGNFDAEDDLSLYQNRVRIFSESYKVALDDYFSNMQPSLKKVKNA